VIQEVEAEEAIVRVQNKEMEKRKKKKENRRDIGENIHI
jgi:hypothetical protein